MNRKWTKVMFGGAAALALLASMGQMQTAAADAQTSAELTEAWFGEEQVGGILSEEALSGLQPYLAAYADEREQSFLGVTVDTAKTYDSSLSAATQTAAENTSADSLSVYAASDAVSADEQTRSDLVAQMEARMQITITDADTTVLVRDITEDGDRITLTLYEWTFFDYLDPEGDGVTTDVSGYGVTHTLVLEAQDSGYLIVSDTYDEGDLTGMQSSDYVGEEMEESEELTVEVALEQTQKGASYASGYDPAKAAAYADKYVKKDICGSIDESSYNLSSYVSMNGIGGDCTNFVSQCIYAGGMQMDDTWFYKSASSYSGAWSTSRLNYSYMSTKGTAVKNPSASDIYLGCPVYYQSSSSDHITHSTICVGKNSAGVPIIDSHNKDYYHVRWNYWGDSATYYTVKLTKTNGASNAAAAATATPRPVISTNVYGDLNDNGRVDAGDALEILKGIVKLHTFTSKDKKIGDVDGDGDVDATDALLVLKKTVDLISRFPVEE